MDAKSKIVLGREKITRAILAEASKAMPEFGMELVDVRIKQLNYVEKVREKVYERMISGTAQDRPVQVRRGRGRDPRRMEKELSRSPLRH